MHVLIEFQILRVIEKSRGITFNLQDHLLGGVSIPHTHATKAQWLTITGLY